MNDIKNKRIIVSSQTITIKNWIGTTTIKRSNIEDMLHCVGLVKYFRAILRIAFLITIIEGVRLFFYHAMVEITQYNERGHKRIWFKSKSEYDEFCNDL